MKRTTIFLTDELDHLLREASLRTRRPQAEIVREALLEHLRSKARPWPRSIGLGESADDSVTSDNVKEWVRQQWDRELDDGDGSTAGPPSC